MTDRVSEDELSDDAAPVSNAASLSTHADVLPKTDNARVASPPRPNRRGRPTPEAAADLTRFILDVAHQEFLARGFAGCSIDRIAKSCGINKHTFYRRFASKDDLFLALCWQHTDTFFGTLHGLEEDPADALLYLKTVIRGIFESYCQPKFVGLMRIIISENVVSASVKAELSRARVGGLVVCTDRLIALAQSRGQIVEGSVPMMRDLLLQSTSGAMLMPVITADENFRAGEERDTLFQYLWDAFVHRFGSARDNRTSGQNAQLPAFVP